jgi:hypothetical protein
LNNAITVTDNDYGLAAAAVKIDLTGSAKEKPPAGGGTACISGGTYGIHGCSCPLVQMWKPAGGYGGGGTGSIGGGGDA